MSDITFSAWLLVELVNRGWSQADLARETGLTTGGISNLINQVRKPSPEACNAIARALKMPAETVNRIAGNLPPAPDVDEKAEVLYHRILNLPPAQREQAEEYVAFLAERHAGEQPEPTPSAAQPRRR